LQTFTGTPIAIDGNIWFVTNYAVSKKYAVNKIDPIKSTEVDIDDIRNFFNKKNYRIFKYTPLYL